MFLAGGCAIRDTPFGLRMGGTHRLGPKGNADTGALWKNDRKGLGRCAGVWFPFEAGLE